MLGIGGVIALAFAAVLATTGVRALERADVPACTGAARLDLPCHVRRYDVLARTQGPRVALAELKAARDGDGYVRTACHQLAHVVGRAAGEQRALADAFADGPADGGSLCSGGYFHGVVESAMARLGADPIRDRAREVCAPLRDTAPRAPLHYYCAHGTGHGFMALYASDVHAALAGCDLLEPWEAGHCAGGVFMENLTAVHNPQRPSRFVRPDDPLYPCAEVAARYRTECYDKQTSYAMYLADDDVTTVFAECVALPDTPGADRTACVRGLGGKIAILANKFVTGRDAVAVATRSMCLLGPDAATRTDCVIGSVTAHVRDHSGVAEAEALCAALRADPGPLAAVCDVAVRDAVATWGLLAAQPVQPAHPH